MYDHVLRAQRPSVLEWLVVNALIPSVLVSFAHHIWQIQHLAHTRAPRVACHAGFLLPSDGFEPGKRISDGFPVLVHMPTPAYPAILRRAGIEDRVILRALVDVQGRVDTSSVLVVQATEPQFLVAARQALKRSRFRPGRFAGTPTAAWAIIAIDFTLTGEAR